MQQFNQYESANLVKERLLADTVLNKLGYRFASEDRRNSKLIGDSYIYTFKNDSVNRRVKFVYSPSVKAEPVLNMYIENAQHESLSVVDYLRYKSLLPTNVYPFSFRSYEGDFSVKLSSILAFVDEVSATELSDFLLGKPWEQVPFDWHGYK